MMKKYGKTSPPINWRDIISIDNDNYFSGNTNNPQIHYINRTEKFLDKFQSSKFGQEKLYQIQMKYQNKKLNIGFNDNFRSVTFPDGQITIDVRDEDSLAFIDQNSCEPKNMSIERILTHELIHAADPRIELRKDNKEECHNTLVEEYATIRTDKYGKLHAPEFGKRAAYKNCVSASKKDTFFKTEQGNAIDLIKNNPELQEKINDIVINLKSTMKSCVDEIKNFNGIKLPITHNIPTSTYNTFIPR